MHGTTHSQVEAGKGPITDYTELPMPERMGPQKESAGGAGGEGGAEEGAALVQADLVAIEAMLGDIRVLDARDNDKQI